MYKKMQTLSRILYTTIIRTQNPRISVLLVSLSWIYYVLFPLVSKYIHVRELEQNVIGSL